MMRIFSIRRTVYCLLLCMLAAPLGQLTVEPALAAASRALPVPETQGGMPLMEALSARAATRNFSEQPLSEQHLSNLLWAAWGINRPDGRRTAPTAMNRQQVLVFIALESGVWQYQPKEHALSLVVSKDMRATYKAPATVLLAAPVNDEFAGMHVGSIYQNIGLYCASAGLNNVVKASGREALANALPLPDDYRVQIVHSVGFPR